MIIACQRRRNVCGNVVGWSVMSALDNRVLVCVGVFPTERMAEHHIRVIYSQIIRSEGTSGRPVSGGWGRVGY